MSKIKPRGKVPKTASVDEIIESVYRIMNESNPKKYPLL